MTTCHPKLYLTLFFIALLSSCHINAEDHVPWEGLSWLNKGSAKIIVRNVDNGPENLRITFFNRCTFEEIEKDFNHKKGSLDSLVIQVFRPELIRFELGALKYFTYLIPNMDMHIEVSDDIKYVGDHRNDYTYLRKFGGYYIRNPEYNQVPDDSIVLPWLSEYLEKSELLKSHYTTYSKAGYQYFSGAAEALVDKQYDIYSDSLLNEYDEGLYNQFHTLLLSFKSNYELMSTTSVMQDDNARYELLKYRTDQLMKIENDDVRFNLLAISAEALIRKRSTYSGKKEEHARIMDHLPASYGDKLKEIEKEYVGNGYDQEQVLDLLSQPVASLEGDGFPLATAGGFKLLKFWFAGCAPCKREIPFEKQLMTKYPNLSLLYFCNKTPEGTWRSYIDNYDLKGHHFFLNQNEYGIYQEVFELDVSPRYVLLDKSNKVICWNCPNPSDSALAKLFE